MGAIALMLLLPTGTAGQIPGSGFRDAAAGANAEARIEAARQRVAASGLPVVLLDQRIAEGRAKGVPLNRIAEVVERRANALLAAGNALRPTVAAPSAAELGAGADAVEAGIPADALRRVIADARSDDRAVALAVLTFLHSQRGLPVETALERVREAAARGPAALRDLPARAAAARGGAGPPANGRVRAPGERIPRARPNAGNPAGTRPGNSGGRGGS
jgi:hypothetical protein